MLTVVNTRRADDLVAVALDIVRREGPAALTMRSVAAAAGLTATALYRHFTDKDALLAEVVREAYRAFRRALIVEAPSSDPGILLRVAFDRFLRFGLENPNYYRLLFAEPHGLGIDHYPHDFASGRSPTFRQLRDIVAACMDARILAGDSERDAPDVALTVYAQMHGLIMLHLAGRFPDTRVFQRFFAESMERLVVGLAV